MQNGKGSKPRPLSSYAKYADNWDEISWHRKEEDTTISNDQTENTEQQELTYQGD